MTTGSVKLEKSCDKDPNLLTVTTIWGRDRAVSLRRRAQLQRQPVHMFFPLDPTHTSCAMLDIDSFVNREEFVMNYGEEHLLLPQCPATLDMMIYHAIVPTDENAPIIVDTKNLPEYEAFLITLMVPGITAVVAPHTSLKLLNSAAKFNVDKVMMTGKDVRMLKDAYDCARFAANAVAEAVATNSSSSDINTRKRKGLDLPVPIPCKGPRISTPPPASPYMPQPFSPLPFLTAVSPTYSPTSPAYSLHPTPPPPIYNFGIVPSFNRKPALGSAGYSSNYKFT